MQADQICYAVLCVFSYMAAGQEQKKNFNLEKVLAQHQVPKQQPLNPLPITTATTTVATSPQNKTQTVVSPQQKTTAQNVVLSPPKPNVTIETIQPQTKISTPSPPSSISPRSSIGSAKVPPQKTPSLPVTASISEKKLPQVPPRVQSQGSTTSRGPPPAIPPRANVAAPTRASSVQVTSTSTMNRPTLTRQQSANSTPPQFIPQPPPKFVIPTRQASRTSLGRSGSVSGPSSSGTSPPSSISPQTQRRQQ